MGKSEYNLCSPSTIPSSIKLLNSELNILDFKLISRKDQDDKATLVQLINVCYELVNTIKINNAKINQQFEELYRCQSTLKSEIKEKDRLKVSLANETKKVEDLKTKLKINDSLLTSTNSQMKMMKQNVSQLQHAISLQKLRHEHEARRKDVVISALKTKIYQSFSNESSVTNDKPTTRKANSILSDQYDEILDRYVCQLHNNIQIVLGENAKYRTLLENIYEKLSVEVIDCTDSTWENLSGLPCHSAVKAIEKTFNVFIRKNNQNESL